MNRPRNALAGAFVLSPVGLGWVSGRVPGKIIESNNASYPYLSIILLVFRCFRSPLCRWLPPLPPVWVSSGAVSYPSI